MTLNYTISATGHTTTHPPTSLSLEGRKTYWQSYRDKEVITLCLARKGCVSHLKVMNRSTASMDVYAAVKGKRRGYLKVREGVVLPHDHLCPIAMGHIPCKYIKIICYRGRPSTTTSNTTTTTSSLTTHPPIALYSITIKGIYAKALVNIASPGLSKILYNTPEQILFGESLELSLDPVYHPPKKPSLTQLQDEAGGGGGGSSSSSNQLPWPGEEEEDDTGGYVVKLTRMMVPAPY